MNTREIVQSKFNLKHFLLLLVLDAIILIILFWISVIATLAFYGANGVIQNNWTGVIGASILMFVLIFKSNNQKEYDRVKNYFVIFLMNWLVIVFEDEIMSFIDGLF